MPVICTKNQNNRYKALITSRISSKKQTENDSAQTLRTFAIKSSEPEPLSNPTFQAGAAIPNSTTKKAALNENNRILDVSSDTIESNSVVDKDDKENKEGNKGEKKIKAVRNQMLAKIEEKDEKFSTENCQTEVMKSVKSVKSVKSPIKTASIISGSEKLQELQELQKQLHKSYEAKPLFEPRRPTLDSIKSAIEKAKLEYEKNKNVGTEEDDDDRSYIVLKSDASTSTEKLKKKTRKKKKDPEKAPPSATTQNSSPTTSAKPKVKKKKKLSIAVKLDANVDRSSQP